MGSNEVSNNKDTNNLDDFDSMRDILEDFYETGGNIKQKKSFSVDKSKVNSVLVIMQLSAVRNYISKALDELKLSYQVLNNYEEVLASEYARSDMYILDVKQGNNHSVTELQTLINNDIIPRARFVLVGPSQADARENEWGQLGRGMFMRSSIPTDWIVKKLTEFLSVDESEEKKDIEYFDQPMILIVDDDQMHVEAMANILKGKNFRINAAKDGKEAIKAIRKNNPDLVLLDIDMPFKSGIEVLRIIRVFRNTEHIPVIIITGQKKPDIVDEALEMGVSDFLIKPLDEEKLLDRIYSVLKINGNNNQG